ncbi:MAG: NUDIX hydrolase [Bacteroidota bacterium]
MENPWKIKSKQEIYNNPWIKLTEHQVTTPGGNPGIYSTVHFHNRAVGVVPYQDGYIWMVGQFRFPLDEYHWEIPEGGCPPGEDLLVTAERELKEETGLIAERYEPIVEMHLSNAVSDEWAIIYLATGLTEGEAEPEESEAIDIQKWTLEELYQKVEAGEITDSMTVAAIYKMQLLKLEDKL